MPPPCSPFWSCPCHNGSAWKVFILCLCALVLPLRGDKIDSVVIMTQGRSGSTFVGELLSKINGAIYLYEPCRSITMTLDENGDGKFGPVDEGDCQAMVSRLMGCSITEDDATALFQDWVAITKCNVRVSKRTCYLYCLNSAPRPITARASCSLCLCELDWEGAGLLTSGAPRPPSCSDSPTSGAPRRPSCSDV